jgi:hypothetical protein
MLKLWDALAMPRPWQEKTQHIEFQYQPSVGGGRWNWVAQNISLLDGAAIYDVQNRLDLTSTFIARLCKSFDVI